MSELCQILYSEEYTSTMADLRKSLEQQAYTEDALALTEKALGLLASHYTTWHYRFDIVTRLQKNLFEELDWCEEIALENQKNYQIWNYRQRVIEEIMKDPVSASKFRHNREYPIMNVMLEQDPKNHHVWSYRKWLVERFSLYSDESELAFTEKLIEADVRNNSAWTHRFFLKFKSGNTPSEIIEQEIEFAKLKIELCPQNPSTWNYIRGIFNKSKRDLTVLKSFCLTYGDVDQEIISSSFASEVLAKIAILEQDFENASHIYEALSSRFDPIRKKYWTYLRENIRNPQP